MATATDAFAPIYSTDPTASFDPSTFNTDASAANNVSFDGDNSAFTTAQTQTTADPGKAAAEAVAIDLDDPELLAFEFETNSGVDAYEMPPPVDDGKYRVKLKQIDVKDAKGNVVRWAVKKKEGTNEGRPYAYTAIEAQILQPGGKFDGLKVRDSFISTMKNKRNGGVPVVTILDALGVKVPQKANAKELMELLLKTLAGEPELVIETAWEGQVSQEETELYKAKGLYPPTVRGQHRFPEVSGVRQVETEIQGTLGKHNVRAQSRIIRYFKLGTK
jgi:hypothetical protein